MGICHADFSLTLKALAVSQGHFSLEEQRFGEYHEQTTLSAITIIVAFLAVAFIVTSKPNTQEKITMPTVGILQLVTHPA